MLIREAIFEGLEKQNDWEKLTKTLLGGKQPKMNGSVIVKFYIDRLKCKESKENKH
jgi:hypothetical protein